MRRKIIPVLVILTVFSSFALAQPARRAPIVEYVDPSEDPTLSDEKKTNIVRHWLTCIECGGQHVDRLVGFGNDILVSLEKAYDGDDEFLDLTERKAAYAASYDSFKNYLTRPPEPGDRAEFIQNEADKLILRVRGRAETVLKTIGTLEACAILDPGLCPPTRIPPIRMRRDP